MFKKKPKSKDTGFAQHPGEKFKKRRKNYYVPISVYFPGIL
jgi:hypothetical protein